MMCGRSEKRRCSTGLVDDCPEFQRAFGAAEDGLAGQAYFGEGGDLLRGAGDGVRGDGLAGVGRCLEQAGDEQGRVDADGLGVRLQRDVVGVGGGDHPVVGQPPPGLGGVLGQPLPGGDHLGVGDPVFLQQPGDVLGTGPAGRGAALAAPGTNSVVTWTTNSSRTSSQRTNRHPCPYGWHRSLLSLERTASLLCHFATAVDLFLLDTFISASHM